MLNWLLPVYPLEGKPSQAPFFLLIILVSEPEYMHTVNTESTGRRRLTLPLGFLELTATTGGALLTHGHGPLCLTHVYPFFLTPVIPYYIYTILCIYTIVYIVWN